MEISSRDVKSVFSSHLMMLVWKEVEELNSQILGEALLLEQNSPSERMSNAGGWQSRKTTLRGEDPFSAARDMLIHATDLYARQHGVSPEVSNISASDFSVWVNINREGDYNRIHNHGGALWSGVYYVEVDLVHDAANYSGYLTFRSPTLAPLTLNNLRGPDWTKALYPADYRIRPVPGLMIIFPSWLEHQVLPFSGIGRRVSLSWDYRPC